VKQCCKIDINCMFFIEFMFCCMYVVFEVYDLPFEKVCMYNVLPYISNCSFLIKQQIYKASHTMQLYHCIGLLMQLHFLHGKNN